MAEVKEKKKVKRPTAEKRLIQNEKQREINRSFKSRVKTAINAFEKTLQNGETDAKKASLNSVFSLMDKGVKRGIFKQNKADRTKSRLSAKVS